jgi:hypothetical protein
MPLFVPLPHLASERLVGEGPVTCDVLRVTSLEMEGLINL